MINKQNKIEYLNEFFNRNKNKSFFTNLKKYSNLEYNDKCKVVSSFLTHLFIDKDYIGDNEVYREVNRVIIMDLVSILLKMVLYDEDNFIEFLNSVGGE